MFALIESCPDSRPGLGWTGKAASFAIHSFLITLAAAVARPAVHEPPAAITVDSMTWVSVAPTAPTAPPLSAPGINPGHSIIDGRGLQFPATIPINVPPPGDPVSVSDPGSAAIPPGFGPVMDPMASVPLASATVVDERVVEERPELLSHPTIRYPETLRQAGIEGRVLVETVVDTLGRAEPERTHVVSSAHPLFDAEALSVVLGSRYRPGRVAGRAVRVRVQVPVNFAIR
jgi:protein TonB